jgi:hypothetical protein
MTPQEWSPTEFWVYTYSPATGWSPATRLPRPWGLLISGAQLSLDDAGNALVAWHQSEGAMAKASEGYPAQRHNLLVTRYAPGSGWSPARTVAEGPSLYNTFFVQLDGKGEALALWNWVPPAPSSGYEPRLRWFR